MLFPGGVMTWNLMTFMKPTVVITEFIFFHVCLTPRSVPPGLSLIGNLSAWNSRPNFYRRGIRPKLPNFWQNWVFRGNQKIFSNLPKQGGRKEEFQSWFLASDNSFHLPQTRNSHASISYAVSNPLLLWPQCPLIIGSISICTMHPACPLPVC